MHICIVTTEYLPGPGGGVATYNAIISQLLVQAGHEVTVVVKLVDLVEVEMVQLEDQHLIQQTE